MKMSPARIAVAVAAGAVLLGGGSAASTLALAGHSAPAVAPATASPAKPTPASPPATPKATAKPARPATQAPAHAGGTTYNGPVTIINQAPQPGSTVYVPIPSYAPAYVTTNQGVVQQYYDYLNTKNFSAAWAMGGRYIGGSDYASWAAGYATTSWITLSTWDYYPGYNAVGVTITAGQSDGSVRTYAGSYTVSGGVITSASITQASGGGSPAQVAPPGLRYVSNGVFANSATSDGFALNVEQAAAASGYASSITAYSPATGQSYTMTQTGTSPYAYQGGDGSLVEFSS